MHTCFSSRYFPLSTSTADVVDNRTTEFLLNSNSFFAMLDLRRMQVAEGDWKAKAHVEN